jgi:hypothetical protein
MYSHRTVICAVRLTQLGIVLHLKVPWANYTCIGFNYPGKILKKACDHWSSEPASVNTTTYFKPGHDPPDATAHKPNVDGAADPTEGRWEMDSLGTWISPSEVANGAAKGLHAIDTGVRFSMAKTPTQLATGVVATKLTAGSVDAALVRWGAPQLQLLIQILRIILVDPILTSRLWGRGAGAVSNADVDAD